MPPTQANTSSPSSADAAPQPAESVLPYRYGQAGEPLAGPPPEGRRLLHGGLAFAMALLVAAAVLKVYWPVLDAKALSFDDEAYTTGNVLVQHPSWSSAARFFREVTKPSTVPGYYQPLTMISLMLDATQVGRPDDLRPWHRTNLVLHAANAALVVLFLYMLFGRPLAAGLGGLIFALHPVHVMTLAWLCERKSLLSTFFVLWCFILYLRYVRTKGQVPFWSALGCFVLALLSKPISVPLPILLLLLDYWPLRRLNRRALWEKIPFFALALVGGIIAVISQARSGVVTADSQYLLLRLPKACCLAFYYLAKLVLPFNLSNLYSLPTPFPVWSPWVLAAVAGAIILIASLIYLRRRMPAVAALFAFFFVALGPSLGIVGFTWIDAADKYLYLPAIALGIGVAALAAHLRSRSLPAFAVFFALMIAAASAESVLAGKTLSLWRDNETLCSYQLDLCRRKADLHIYLAVDLGRKGRLDESIRHLREALREQPDNPDALITLGISLGHKGRLDESIEHLRHALRLRPDSDDAYTNLGNVFKQRGDLVQAIQFHREALRINPDKPEAWNNLGTALLAQGNLAEAAGSFKKALALMPAWPLPQQNLGKALLRLGRTEEGFKALYRAVDLEPARVEPRHALADALFAHGRTVEAIRHYREALRLKPDSVVFLNMLAWVLAVSPSSARAEQAEAITLAQRACTLEARPNPALLDTLAAAYAATGQFPQAIDTAERAVALAGKAPSLLADIQARLALYRAGKPYRETPRGATTATP